LIVSLRGVDTKDMSALEPDLNIGIAVFIVSRGYDVYRTPIGEMKRLLRNCWPQKPIKE
jgi:hypothetical protein